MAETSAAEGPDLAAGVAISELPDEGTICARVGNSSVLLSRIEGEFFAISATCTHYGGDLARGAIGRRTVRCPLHHACFDLKSGMMLRTPALDPLDCWRVETIGTRLFVREKLSSKREDKESGANIGDVVIVGGGAAGLSCASELRKLGFGGAITILTADADPPCDRPNLSKDYLAGTAPEEWIPLRSNDWYNENNISLRLNATVESIDVEARSVILQAGEPLGFDRLLLATGSEPRRLAGDGLTGENVYALRSLNDARAIIDRATAGMRAAIVGASFIGLEAAAALRNRGVEIAIVSPEEVPFEPVFGRELGAFIRGLHEDNGVQFHLGARPSSFASGRLFLDDGTSIEADLLLVGIGVVPRTELAEGAQLSVNDGVWVDEFMETSSPGIFAAGDIASYPDRLGGGRARVEHWVVAERQGQVAAANMLGRKEEFRSAPFFWTEHYGVTIRYTGHANAWVEVRVDGEIGTVGCVLRYFRKGQHLASASINRDRDNLRDEMRLEDMATAIGTKR